MFHFVPLGFLAIFYYRIAGAQVVPNGLLSQDLVVDHDVNAFILRRGKVFGSQVSKLRAFHQQSAFHFRLVCCFGARLTYGKHDRQLQCPD